MCIGVESSQPKPLQKSSPWSPASSIIFIIIIVIIINIISDENRQYFI